LPFFIQWEDGHHPSEVGTPVAKISKIEFANSDPISKSSFDVEIEDALKNASIEIYKATDTQDIEGISSIAFETPNGVVKID